MRDLDVGQGIGDAAIESGAAGASSDGACVQTGNLQIRLVDGAPSPAPTPSAVQRWGKRAIDLALSSLLLLLLMPLLVGVAACVKATSRGPVFFVQRREGIGDTNFRIIKFRTLRLEDCDATGIHQPAENDSRLTPIGALLRRTSLDELPQLFNVLRGEMSLVGPRPHVAHMEAAGMRYDELVPYYRYRRSVLPGLTGWAQANGYRGSTADRQRAMMRIAHDVAYVQNQSLWLDLRILLLTVRHEVLRSHAR